MKMNNFFVSNEDVRVPTCCNSEIILESCEDTLVTAKSCQSSQCEVNSSELYLEERNEMNSSNSETLSEKSETLVSYDLDM